MLSFFPLLFHLQSRLSACKKAVLIGTEIFFLKLFQRVTFYVLFCCSLISNINQRTDKEQKEAWNNSMRNCKYWEIKDTQWSAHGCLYWKVRLISLHHCWPRAPLILFEELHFLGMFGGLIQVNFNQHLLLCLYIHNI